MRAVRRFSFLLSISLLSACASDTILDLEIGDVGGLWLAASYEYVSNVSSARIDIIERDGTTFTLSVDDSFRVIHDKDFMTLTKEASQFDFGIGSLTATVVIAPDRI